MSEHTKEPWEVFPPNDPIKIKTACGHPGMDDSQLQPVKHLGQGVNREANAQRIVDCVNAMAGIDKPGEFVETMECLLKGILAMRDLWLPPALEPVAAENAGEALALSLMNNNINKALALFPTTEQGEDK